MSDTNESILEEPLSPNDVSTWAKKEIRNSAKAFELRSKEATEISERFAAGEISSERAQNLLLSYDRRWGDALFGVSDSENLSNDEIISKIEEARTKRVNSAASREGTQGTQRGRF